MKLADTWPKKLPALVKLVKSRSKVLDTAAPAKVPEYELGVAVGVRTMAVFAEATAEATSSAAARMVDLKFIDSRQFCWVRMR